MNRDDHTDERPLPRFSPESARESSETKDNLQERQNNLGPIDERLDVAADTGEAEDLGSQGLESVFDPKGFVVHPPRDDE